MGLAQTRLKNVDTVLASTRVKNINMNLACTRVKNVDMGLAPKSHKCRHSFSNKHVFCKSNVIFL